MKPRELLSKRWPWITGMVLVLIAYASTFVKIEQVDQDRRPIGTVDDIVKLRERDVNVLFVLIDTLRAEHLGSWGYERDTSPVLDAIAARGVRFARNLSQCSWTKSSMASMWTGLSPTRLGVTRFNHLVPQEATMAAEVFRDAGFRTVGLYRNGWVSGYFGFDQGFEVYERPVSRPDPPNVRRENPTMKQGGNDMDAVDAAFEFLRIHGDERWFLYLHHMDVHEYLYDEYTAVFGVESKDAYDNAILRQNNVINELILRLSKQGYLDNTLVVIVSDHGEAFGERGFEGHARFVYRETNEVPLILSFPFQLKPGIVVETRTSNIDIWPTVFDLLGLPPLEGVDGRSRVPEILAAARGEAPPEETPAFAFLDQRWGTEGSQPLPTWSIADGPYRYVLTHTAANQAPLEQLFDASGDPSELEDQLAAKPEIASRLRELARQQVDAPAPPWGERKPETLELDEMQLNQLRALGYAVP